jgi:hypothetical protein
MNTTGAGGADQGPLPVHPMHHPRHMRRVLARRLLRNALTVAGLIAVALFIGALGYHELEGLGWLDATLNAAMILTGMGPVHQVEHPSGKVFAIVYALGSGVFFLTMVAVLLAPALQHLLHRFHLELDEAHARRHSADEHRH